MKNSKDEFAEALMALGYAILGVLIAVTIMSLAGCGTTLKPWQKEYLLDPMMNPPDLSAGSLQSVITDEHGSVDGSNAGGSCPTCSSH